MDARQIAYYLIKIASQESEPEFMTPMRLQKILYYVQGWHLALKDVEAFGDRIEAWKYGPVVSTVYQEFRPYGDQPILPEPIPFPTGLSDEMKIFIKSIWENYKQYSAIALKEKTHNEAPWIEARKGFDPQDPCNIEIRKGMMKEFFRTEYRGKQLSELDLDRALRMCAPSRKRRGTPLTEVLSRVGISHDAASN